MRIATLASTLGLFAILGCVNTDTAIFVDADIVDPSLTVENKALGTLVTGGLTLSLHLGARAADSSEVALQSFEIVAEDQTTVLLDSVPLTASGAQFPVVVEPDTDQDIDLVIDLGADLLPAEVGQDLCNAGKVHYRGTITDSLRGTTVPIVSELVTVGGCAP